MSVTPRRVQRADVIEGHQTARKAAYRAWRDKLPYTDQQFAEALRRVADEYAADGQAFLATRSRRPRSSAR